MAETVEYSIESTGRKWFEWKELWRYRELFYFFTWRDIKIKYKQTVLGFLWAILQPLFMMLIFENKQTKKQTNRQTNKQCLHEVVYV